jgi:hypothetical protein
MTRFELWKDWYKHCTNRRIYKILVLIGLANSPSFNMYEQMLNVYSQYCPDYNFSVRDEKPEKNASIRWGWYITYVLMVIINGLVYIAAGYDRTTWQYWSSFLVLALCFISGANYRKEE